MAHSLTPQRWAATTAGCLLVALSTGCSGGGSSEDPASATPGPTADCAPARPARPTAEPRTFAHGGQDRRYLLALPGDYDGTTAIPLVVTLHGWHGDIETFERTTTMAATGTEQGLAVVTPQGLGDPSRWNWDRKPDGPDDYGFIHALVTDLTERLCIDTDRVFAAGSSNGAAFAGLLVCDAPRTFAAVAMVIATTPSTCPPDVAPSTISIRGTDDGTPAADDMFATDAQRYDCAPPTDEHVADGVTRRTYANCAHDAELVLVTIDGGQHVWPGSPQADQPGNSPGSRDFPATQTILDFFAEHG